MMKLSLALAAGILATAGSANAMDSSALVNAIAVQVNSSPTAALINWKIGDYQDMNMTMQGTPLGTVHKEATSEEGTGVWLTETMTGQMIGNHVVEALIDRNDGHTIKMKQDGQDKPVPTDKLEIINQETATITVPAGTFETIHITAKSEQAGQVEVWANPKAITLDGTAKMAMSAQGMPIGMELTKFGSK